MAAHPKWTQSGAIEALRQFERDNGRKPFETELHFTAKSGLPAVKSLCRLFGSAANAFVMAFGDAPSKDHNSKDEDTEEVIRRLEQGATLKELALERGISGQSLGRRVNRYQVIYGLPVVKRPPGRPRKTDGP